jgi:hypothetical protein
MKHFHGQLQKRYKLSYTVTRLSLQEAGLVRPAPKRSAHRKKRRRRLLMGMMRHPRYIALRPAAGRCSAIRRSATRPAQSVRAFSSQRRARSFRRCDRGGQSLACRDLFGRRATPLSRSPPPRPAASFVTDRGGRAQDIHEERRVSNDKPSNRAVSLCRSRRACCGPQFCARHGAPGRIPRRRLPDLSRAAPAGDYDPGKPVREAKLAA